MTEMDQPDDQEHPDVQRKKRGKIQGSLPRKSLTAPFPIVGIGCSAGGLEALEQFLKNVPPDCGMAFVVIQHMDPTHQGLLTELLQRITRMPVTQVSDKTIVIPDSVYVIPPNKDMALLSGKLHLLDPISPRGLRLPIDLFFRSLAEEMQERSIGVILSGMGTDGTLGLTTIKEKAGVVFVQDPASAKFNGMPLSVIDAGLADFVAPADELPEAIISYTKHAPLIGSPIPVKEKRESSALEKIIIIIRARNGHDFSQYKTNTLYRRVERRMGIHKIEKIAQYVRYLQENNQEVDLLFHEFLIGVTNFFRDPESWEKLKNEALSPLLKNHSFDKPIRAWIPGCSTGEEAYSLAIIIQEILDEIKHEQEGFVPYIQIYATDIDNSAIEKARTGFFPVNIMADISAERLNRFFIKEEEGYRIKKDIRESIVFATHNLIMDPPFTKLDILSCRNLLIYFSADLQKKILPLFHYSLNPKGILFLGSAESIGGNNNLFHPLDTKFRVFIRTDIINQNSNFELISPFYPVVRKISEQKIIQSAEMNIEASAHTVLLQQYSPPGSTCE